MFKSRQANLIKPALITGIPFWLSLSKPDTARPSIRSGRTVFKRRVNKSTGLWTLAFCLAATTSTGVGVELRDPTHPPVQSTEPAVATPSETPLSLTAIMMSDDTRYAIINGKMVKVGDRLDDDSQVVGIRPGRAIIRKTGKNQTLFLVPSVKTR